MVWAQTGCTASANPEARLVTTKPRRETSVGGTRLLICMSFIGSPRVGGAPVQGAARGVQPDNTGGPCPAVPLAKNLRIADDGAVKVVGVGALDLDRRD